MTRSTLPAFILPLFFALGACAEPDADAAAPPTGYRVALVVEEDDDDELELRLLDIDPAGSVREVAMVLDDDEFDDVDAVVSPDGRWLGVARADGFDELPYTVFDLDRLDDDDRIEGHTLELVHDGGATFSADSTVLALANFDGAYVVSMTDADHTSTDALDLGGERVNEIFARPGSAELVFATNDALWWQRGNAEDGRVRELVRPYDGGGSPFLDATTFHFATRDTWAFADVVDGVVANVEEIEITDDDEIVLCDELIPLAKDGRKGGVCEAGDAYYWVDAHDVKSPWQFHDREADIEDVALSAGARYLVYVAREEGEGGVLHAVDLETRGKPVEIGEAGDVEGFATCFGQHYVVLRRDLHRIDGLDRDVPALVEIGEITGLDDHSWHCMPDEDAAVLVSDGGVYLIRADEPDTLHEIARDQADGHHFRAVGAADATRVVYRDVTCEDVEVCDAKLIELSTVTGEIRSLVDADIRDAYMMKR